MHITDFVFDGKKIPLRGNRSVAPRASRRTKLAGTGILESGLPTTDLRRWLFGPGCPISWRRSWACPTRDVSGGPRPGRLAHLHRGLAANRGLLKAGARDSSNLVNSGQASGANWLGGRVHGGINCEVLPSPRRVLPRRPDAGLFRAGRRQVRRRGPDMPPAMGQACTNTFTTWPGAE